MKRRILFLFFLASNFQLPTSNFLWAGSGETTAEFLRLGVGGRAAGMEGAYSAVAGEASALYWNPAGLKNNGDSGMSATFMHAVYLEQTSYDYAAFGRNTRKGSLGLGIQYFSAGSIAQTDETGSETGTFKPNDMAVTLGYAQRIRGFSLGMGAKYIKLSIVDSAATFAADFGVLTPKIFGGKLRLSLVASNFGGKIKFDKVSEKLPSAIRVGSALKVKNNWIVAADVEKPLNDNLYGAFGTEYIIMLGGRRAMAVRAGLNTKTMGDVGGFTGFAYGLGWLERNFALDYAIEPLGTLGLNHRVSVTLKF